MLSFLRNIRRSLLSSGSARRYLYYGLGEFILIVAGILVAIQINNWNETRKSERIEHQLLVGLKAEILNNQQILAKSISKYEGYLESSTKILSLFGNWESHITTNFDSIVADMSAGWMFNPRYGLLKSIISSGEIGHISNRQLVTFLSEFDDMVFDIKETTNAAARMWRDQLAPLMTSFIPLNSKYRSAKEGAWGGQPRSPFRSDYAGFFNSMEVEGRIAHMNAYVRHAFLEKKELMGRMESMVSIIDNELMKH